MRQGHVFQSFMTERLTEVHMNSTGNSKKEATRLNEEILSNTRDHKLIRVDATSLSLDKAILLATTARQLLNGMSDNNMTVAIINVQGLEDEMEPLSPDHERILMRKGYYDLVEWIFDLRDFEMLQVFAYLNQKAEEVVALIEEQHNFYTQALISAEGKAPVELSPKRKFRFKPYQTNLFTLYEQCFRLSMQIASPYMAINPNISFQRKLVWPVEKKVSFIDSLINDIPIGSFYVNENIHDLELGEGFGKILWDGKQRIHALHSFLMDEFPVEVDGVQVYYSQSPTFFQHLLRNIQVSMFESSYERLPDIIEAYVAINQKQIRHTDEDLDHARSLIQS